MERKTTDLITHSASLELSLCLRCMFLILNQFHIFLNIVWLEMIIGTWICTHFFHYTFYVVNVVITIKNSDFFWLRLCGFCSINFPLLVTIIFLCTPCNLSNQSSEIGAIFFYVLQKFVSWFSKLITFLVIFHLTIIDKNYFHNLKHYIST